MSECPETDDPLEEEFRRKNNRHGFLAGLYSNLSGATLIAALGAVTSALISAAKLMSAGAASLSFGSAVAASLSGPVGFILLGLVVVGVAAAYFAQREFTNQRCVQDNRFAQKNAQQMAQQRAQQKAQEREEGRSSSIPGITAATVEKPCFECEDNVRKDGKPWVEAVAAPVPDMQKAI